YPVTVSFGKPLGADSKAFEVRQAILELGSDAFRHRLEERRALGPSFFQEARRHPLRFAMADSSGTRLSYGAMLVKALLLGRALDDGTENVGIFLPPSAGAALANWGLILMGRVPVNLNYTSSREVVAHCVKAAGIRKIVTSKLVLHKLGWEPLPEMVYIEEIARGISKPAALWTGLVAFLLPGPLAERLLIPAASVPLERVATIIFTSGSTGMPKGVLLTHANLLSNIEALAQLYQIRPEDRILGALPFFHSFGFTATLLFPPACGFGVVYHYNPLDAKGIGELFEKHAASFVLGTPTFLQAYLRRVEPRQLKSLRCVVVGAEKLREDLAKAFEEKFGLAPLEGYGCTELSPVAAANIQDVDRTGVRQRGTKAGTVGQPLPGVLMRVVHPDTGAVLAPGEPGLLLVKGPNVMKGYLGDPEKTASVLREGYYVTGDIASIDLDGFVSITDRLSRFSKIGGEMVPHVRLEEKLHELAALAEQTFVVTAVPDEKRGERLVVLHKGYGEVGALLKKLNESGVPKLWLPDKDRFHEVAEIPVLGTGKLDMQKIKAMARQMENL
ncbi:MAG: AMP-binding protein, partial [Elusimicrobiota bacterium]